MPPEQPMDPEIVTIERMQHFIKEKKKTDEFSGAALIAKDGKPILEEAVGLANKNKHIHNSMETKFNLGSANKMFTAVGIAQLVEAGKLSFDDPVGKILPDHPNQQVREQVTIHHLLTHTSGLGSFIDTKHREQFLAARPNLKNISDVVDLFKDRPLEFPLGESHYSSDGYELLGVVIETASGQNYYDYIREHIYQPAGMENTDSYEIDPNNPSEDIAIGYTHRNPQTDRMEEGERFDNFDLNLLKGTAGGSGYSTCRDLLKFAQALQEGKLISPEMLGTMLKPYVKEGSKGNQTKYQGYGFQVWDVGGVRRYGHPGRFTGVNARFDVYPDLGYTVIVLANYDPPSAFDIAEEATRLLTSGNTTDPHIN
jgi:D-alanyl-D-alanine carboxypeptidase